MEGRAKEKKGAKKTADRKTKKGAKRKRLVSSSALQSHSAFSW